MGVLMTGALALPGTVAPVAASAGDATISNVSNADLRVRYDQEGYGPYCTDLWELCARSTGEGSVARVFADRSAPARYDGSLRIATPSEGDRVVLQHHHNLRRMGPLGLASFTRGGFDVKVLEGPAPTYGMTLQCDPDVEDRLSMAYAGPAPAARTGWQAVDVVQEGRSTWTVTDPAGSSTQQTLRQLRRRCPDGLLWDHGLTLETPGSASRVDNLVFGEESSNFWIPWVSRIDGYGMSSDYSADQRLIAARLNQRYFFEADDDTDAPGGGDWLDPARQRRSGPEPSALVLVNQNSPRSTLVAGPLADAVNGKLFLGTGRPRPWCPAPGRTVYMVGFNKRPDRDAIAQSQSAGCDTLRLSAARPYRLAVKVARVIDRHRSSGVRRTIVLTSAKSMATALPGSAAAGSRHGAVLFTNGSAMPRATKRYLAAHKDSSVYAIGRQAARAVPALPARRKVTGASRYSTAVNVARRLFRTPRTVAFASGTEYVDALVAGGYSGRLSAPVLLVRRDSVPAPVARYVRDHRARLRESVVVGGESRVSEQALTRLANLLTVR